MRQKVDLVSGDYYAEELVFQKKIDAGKNQASLVGTLDVHANEKAVFITFPKEFSDKKLTGRVLFYSPVNSDWDKTYYIVEKGNSFEVDRSQLQNTKYTLKINYSVDGKSYYQETEIQLHS